MATQRSDTDVIAILTKDHREVEEIFGQLERLPDTEHQRRRSLTDQAIIELVRHAVAEEQYLYPAARRYVPGGDALADRELAEHNQAERTMKELEAAEPGEARFVELLAQLMNEIRQHIREEEGELFPQLAQHADRETLEELGRKVSMAKAAAPTRPHPSTPSDKPGLLKLLAPGVGLVDRARDAVTGRGRG